MTDERREGWQIGLEAAFARPGVLDAMQRGLTSGGFPMIEGEMVSWSQWLIHRVNLECAMLASSPNPPEVVQDEG